MEAIGGVASAITVVTLALQSTKAIYEVASSVKHGSDDIDRLARATSNLIELLEVIMRLVEHAERTRSVAEGKLLKELIPLIDQCANALREIAPKLDQVQKDSKDRRWKRAMKHAKVYLDSKGIAEIWNVVNHYLQLLGSRLTNASVYVGLYNAENFGLLHKELSADFWDMRSNNSRIEDILRNQKASTQAHWDAFQAESHQRLLDAKVAAITQAQNIHELKTGQRQLREAITVGNGGIAGLRADVQGMSTVISDQCHEATARSETFMTEARELITEVTKTSSAVFGEIDLMNAEVLRRLHGISDRLELFPSIASEQLSTLQSLVGMMRGLQLESYTRDQEQPKNTMKELYCIENPRSNDLGTSHDAEIEAILAKICHFAGERKASRYSREAQSVIEDMGWLLGVVMQHTRSTIPNPIELPRKRKTLCERRYFELETAVQTMENLAKAKRVLTASQQVQIFNHGLTWLDKGDDRGIRFLDKTQGSTKIFRRKRTPSTNSQSIVSSWTMQYGRLDASFKTTLFPFAEDRVSETADEAFAAKILLTPISTSVSNLQIVIDIASRTFQDRTVYLTPTLTFRAMVADDSAVLRVVSRGSVKKLRILLSSGAASLGDCDSMGRSLLHYALNYCRREMTRFLIKSGADVESLEPRRYGSYLLPNIKPLEMISHRKKDRTRAQDCYKLLLDAGTDLSSVLNGRSHNRFAYHGSAYSIALRFSTIARVKALLDLGEPFISVSSMGGEDSQETIPLQILAYDQFMQWRTNFRIFEKMALLLSRGADVNARNSRGETCLHRLLPRHYHGDDRFWPRSGTRDIMILLITAGADVCAVDQKGCSISDLAIRSGHLDIWTEALKYCGIDIKDVLARSNLDPAYSTALSSEYSKPPKSLRSKVSMAEYLERRKLTHFPEDAENQDSDVASDPSDDDSESEDCPSFEDEESENGDVVEGTTSIINEANELGEDKEPHVEYEECTARKKAKLE